MNQRSLFRLAVAALGLLVVASLAAISGVAPSQAQGTLKGSHEFEMPPYQKGNTHDLSDSPKLLYKLETGLVIGAVSGGGRSAVSFDHLLARLSKQADYLPKANEALTPALEAKWQSVESGEQPGIEQDSFRGGYIYWHVKTVLASKLLLKARGHDFVLVNGVPRGGDIYNNGRTVLPIDLEAGDNHLFFRCGRGRLQAELWQRPERVFIASQDMTLPDIRLPAKGTKLAIGQGAAASLLAGVVLTNTEPRFMQDLTIHARIISQVERDGEPGFDASKIPSEEVLSTSRVTSIHPLGVQKVPVWLPPYLQSAAFFKSIADQPDLKHITVQFTVKGDESWFHLTNAKIRIRKAQESYKATFLSMQDSSCQYYTVVPALGETKGVVLSLHGASVEATSQAGAYSAKPNLDIVCATNRRPFGFDWEDWGRRDAIEVLDHHLARFRDSEGALPQGFNTYLTGHSMGGHGTWQVAVQNPDRFAAIAPSAGWSDFWSYAGGPDYGELNPATAILLAAANPSRTLDLLPNLKNTGIFILHGDADDNVPVSEARLMRKELEKIEHKDVQWFEAEGKGHWYDLDDEAGTACVDYGPFFDFFARRKLIAAEDVREIDFRTYCPSVASKMHWLEVVQQTRQLELSTIKASRKIHKREFTITTKNVDCFTIDQVAILGLKDLETKEDDFTVDLTIDGQPLRLTPMELSTALVGPSNGDPNRDPDYWRMPNKRIALRLVDGKWIVGAVNLDDKSPYNSGLFKDAFYGTTLVVSLDGGVENYQRALAKARFDSEQFLYRGNGRLPVALDVEGDRVGGNRILYGMSAKAPITVGAGRITLGERVLEGENLALLASWQEQGDRIGMVATTGPAAQHVVNHLRYFLAGTGFPDWVIYSDEMLTKGAAGVVAAGFFDNQWKYDAKQSGFAAK